VNAIGLLARVRDTPQRHPATRCQLYEPRLLQEGLRLEVPPRPRRSLMNPLQQQTELCTIRCRCGTDHYNSPITWNLDHALEGRNRPYDVTLIWSPHAHLEFGPQSSHLETQRVPALRRGRWLPRNRNDPISPMERAVRSSYRLRCPEKPWCSASARHGDLGRFCCGEALRPTGECWNALSSRWLELRDDPSGREDSRSSNVVRAIPPLKRAGPGSK